MEENRVYPDKVTRERYLADLDAVRGELQEYMGLDKKIKEMENIVKQKQEEIEHPTAMQKVMILKKQILIAVVGWIVSDIAVLVSFANGSPAPWAIVIACVEFAWVIYVVKLWKNPGKIYVESDLYKQQMMELEELQNEVKKEHIKISKLDPIILKRIGYVPKKYLYVDWLLKFEQYMRYNGATTLADAINMFEQQKRNALE